jgi:hypothetical protein
MSNIQHNEHAYGKPDSQSRNIDNAVKLLSQQISPGYVNVVFDHDQFISSFAHFKSLFVEEGLFYALLF